MFVQALAEYADNNLASALNDVAWEMKPVPWLIEISQQGTFLAVTPRMTSVQRGKKEVQVPAPMSVPRSPVNRNSGHHPLLAVDDIAYVLGVGAWTPSSEADQEKAAKHFEAFVSLTARAANQTEDPALAACARFYGSPAEVEKARTALAEAKAGSLVGLSVSGPLVDRPAVQAFWRDHYQKAFTGRMEGSTGECLISGNTGVIAPTHEKIKGVSSLGGQAAGVLLMSFDKEAFRSYGWNQNENSPVSPDRAMAYVLALNDLLRINGGHRRDVAGVGFLYWLRSPDDLDVFDIMNLADPQQVSRLLSLQPQADPDPNRFYMAGVSGNGGRLRVRYWVTEALPELKRNLQNWHLQLRLHYPWPDPHPVQLWQLLSAIDRDGEPPAHHAIALLRRALEGSAQPLGYSILSAALNRLRHPGDSLQAGGKDRKADPYSLQRLRVPLSLVRLCLNDIDPWKGTLMTEGLNESCDLPAYVCGRLMAELENLQRESVSSETGKRQAPDGEKKRGDINLTVTDRYFSLASTYPAVAFPRMIMLAQKHKRKLRRDNAPAAYAIDTRLQQLHGLLKPSEKGPYPARLGLADQGLFTLGYYHQKAWSVAQAINRKESNSTTSTTSEQEN